MQDTTHKPKEFSSASVAHERANTRADKPLQIVIAWKEESAEFVEQIYIGGGEYKNVFRDVTVPKTCMWLNNGTRSDIAKARDYMSSEQINGKVFAYQGEPDPLARAKKEILQ